jgi:hypothetical protein
MAIQLSNVAKVAAGGIIRGRAGLAQGMTGRRFVATSAPSVTSRSAQPNSPRSAQPNNPRSAQTGAFGGLSTLSGGKALSFQMLAPHGRERETNGTLTCMTAFVAFLVERLHVVLGRVSSAVWMAG